MKNFGFQRFRSHRIEPNSLKIVGTAPIALVPAAIAAILFIGCIALAISWAFSR